MMKLNELFTECFLPGETAQIPVQGISRDSRSVALGDIFFIIEGESFDVYSALTAIETQVAVFVGAAARKKIISRAVRNKPVIYVEDVVSEFRRCVDLIYPVIPEKFHFIGVTGTNGKTTTAHLIYSLLTAMQKPVSLLGTIFHLIDKKKIAAHNTTPEYLWMRRMFFDMQKQGRTFVVMEASSHGIDQDRIKGIPFSQCVFTNLSRDHLDYHHNMEEYFSAKKKIFLENPGATAVVNVDDFYGERLYRELPHRKESYSLHKEASWQAGQLSCTPRGTEFILTRFSRDYPVCSPLLGEFNVYNLLAALSAAQGAGCELKELLPLVPSLTAPCGRLEKVAGHVYVDYAHTPDALEKTLCAIRDLGYERIICVFGCGGDRDKGKRPLMGEYSSRLADFTVITSDNPRSEPPGEICSQIQEGCVKGNWALVIDRREAIKEALRLQDNNPACAVVVAGKGHEDYQVVGKEKVYFSDQEEIKKILGEVER